MGKNKIKRCWREIQASLIVQPTTTNQVYLELIEVNPPVAVVVVGVVVAVV